MFDLVPEFGRQRGELSFDTFPLSPGQTGRDSFPSSGFLRSATLSSLFLGSLTFDSFLSQWRQ